MYISFEFIFLHAAYKSEHVMKFINSTRLKKSILAFEVTALITVITNTLSKCQAQEQPNKVFESTWPK